MIEPDARHVIDYVLVKLEDVSTITSGDQAPQYRDLFINGMYPIFRVSDVAKEHISSNLTESADRLNEEGIDRLKLFTKGSILFPKSGESCLLNHRAVMGCDGYVDYHLAVITPDKKRIIPMFLFYVLTSLDAKTLVQNDGCPLIRVEDLGCAQIPLPPLPEQQKIVDALDPIQRSIEALKQGIEALQSCGWGRLSLDFGNEPVWSMRLGDLIEVNYGTRIDKDDNVEKLYPVYDGDGVSFYTNRYNLENAIIIGRSGLSKECVRYIEGKFWLNDNGVSISVTHDTVCFSYLKYALLQMSGQIYSCASGSAQKVLSIDSLKNLTVQIPSLIAQHEIADKLNKEIDYIKQTESAIANQREKMQKVIAKLWRDIT